MEDDKAVRYPALTEIIKKQTGSGVIVVNTTELSIARAELAAAEQAASELERLQVQLAGCGVAALGWSKVEQRAKQGDYGWSASYQDVLNLREKWEALNAPNPACPVGHLARYGTKDGCMACALAWAINTVGYNGDAQEWPEWKQSYENVLAILDAVKPPVADAPTDSQQKSEER